MKHQATQFELPGTVDAFNLAVQCTAAVETVQPLKSTLDDNTLEMFAPVCGKKLFGFMPPCVLAAGHAGECQDGFGGSYRHADTEGGQP